MNDIGIARLPAHILFGEGQRHALPGLIRPMGRRAFLCVDPFLRQSATWLGPLIAEVEASGVDIHIFSDIAAELPASCLARALEEAKAFDPALVIGIGGGSSMDLAKLAAMLLTHGGEVRDYYGEMKVPGPILPVIAMPTTAGTGSEVTPVAVIEDPSRATKVGISSPYLIPRIAICDPELTWSCPPQLTAASGADAFTHAVEAFTAARKAPHATVSVDHVFVGKNVLSDQFALSAIGLIGRSLARAVADGQDQGARSDIMLAALLAGMAFGTAGTAAAHALQYPVGAITHTAHGVGVATLLPYVMQFNRPACTIEFAQIAKALGQSGGSDEESADLAILAVANLFQTIGIPADLAALSMPRDQIRWSAEQAFTAKRLIDNNPRPLNQDALEAILDASLSGDRFALQEF